MKKWLVTFCALGLISTQAATADAASNTEKVQDPSVQRIVKMVKKDQVENVFAELIDIIGKNQVSFNDFSNKLLVKKVTLEKLLKATENKESSNESKKEEDSVAPSNTKVTKQEDSVAPSNTKVTKQEETVTKQEETVTKEVEKEPVSTPAPQEKESKKSSNEVPKSNVQTTVPTTNQPVETEKPTQAAQTTPAKAETNTVSEFEAQVVELTNAERAKYGLAPLEAYQPVMATAHAKSEDMSKNNYFSHTSPTYGSPFDQMRAAGISYRAAGENIAQGQRTPAEVVQAWMNSEGHRANILNASFTHIGVGYVASGNYWTQQFVQL